MDTMYQQAIDESIDNYMGYDYRSIENTEAIGGDPLTYDDGTTIVGRTQTPSNPANGSDYYKYVGGAGGPSSMGNGNYFLEIGPSDFGAWEGNGYPFGSGLHDDFAYDTSTGTMYVEGTVFVDGDLHIDTTVTNYAGNGTIVVNGDVFIGGEVEPVGGTMSAENCVGIVCPGDVVIGDNAHSGNTRGGWEGAIFCNGEVSLYHTQSHFEGSILADTIYGDKPDITIRTNPDLPDFIPTGMPALGGVLFPGNWSRN
jgi:hypothetical protein